jgi:glycosyltransferase involved in cell wall biosynthesis
MISIIIPLFNEEANVPILAGRLSAALRTLGRDYEVILINDGSTDATGEQIKKVCAADPCLKSINLRRNYGQTTAIVAGFHHAKGEIIVTMDGDLQNEPEDIPLLLAKLDDGFDVVSGWRSDRKDDALQRNLPSVLANRLISTLTGVKLHDFGCSLKAYRRSIIRHVHLYGEMHRFIPIYCVLSGARLAEIPVRHSARLHGTSKYGLERVFKVLCDLSVVWFLQRYGQKPMYLFGGCALVSFAGSGLSGLWALYLKLFENNSFIQTPLPLVSGTLFLVGVLCVLMGLLAELSIRIYHESQDKPTYLIDRTDNLTPRADAT